MWAYLIVVFSRDALDLIVKMHRDQEHNIIKGDAMNWLADQFGGDRAAGAYRANQEHELEDFFERRQREKQEKERGMERPGQEREHTRLDREGHERDGPDRGRAPDHDIGFSR